MAALRVVTERWVGRIACIRIGQGLLPAMRRPANSLRLAPTCERN